LRSLVFLLLLLLLSHLMPLQNDSVAQSVYFLVSAEVELGDRSASQLLRKSLTVLELLKATLMDINAAPMMRKIRNRIPDITLAGTMRGSRGW